MNHNPIRPQPSGYLAALQDIGFVFLPSLRLVAGKIDKIGGVYRQQNAVLRRLSADFFRRFPAYANPSAALIFQQVQAPLTQPSRRVYCRFVTAGKRIAVARWTEFCHILLPAPRPSCFCWRRIQIKRGAFAENRPTPPNTPELFSNQ